MLRFGEIKIAKKLLPCKNANKYFGIVISKLIETKTNSKYLIGYSDKNIRSLVLMLPKISEYVKTFKVKDKNNNLTSFHINDQKLLEKHETIWPKIEDLKSIELNTLPVYDDRYIETKIRTYGSKYYNNSCGLNMSEDDIEWESFTVISLDSLLVYENKYYLQVYLENCAYKTIDKRMIDYLHEN